MEKRDLACPFVYANGKRCSGYVSGWRLYGGQTIHTARKVRLWCSEKWDHCGSVNTWMGKEQMEFYPDKLPRPIFEAIAISEPQLS